MTNGGLRDGKYEFGSRFDVDFMEYIMDDKTRCAVVHGVPNCTRFWQVADKSRHNGLLKYELAKFKHTYVETKLMFGGDGTLKAKR